jgi:hypothetical protein
MESDANAHAITTNSKSISVDVINISMGVINKSSLEETILLDWNMYG